jgi:hypothetical protein
MTGYIIFFSLLALMLVLEHRAKQRHKRRMDQLAQALVLIAKLPTKFPKLEGVDDDERRGTV